MSRHGVTFNKGYGQNFLINEAVPRRIAEECGASPDDGILEIGPGIGTLTVELARRYKKVVSVEIDDRLIPVLNETLAEFENTEVINADFMKTDAKKLIADKFGGMNVTVCANLPYYITSPILMKLLESELELDNITVMVQKEVALRLCSKPGESDYSALTASVMRYGKVEKLFGVSAGSFMPAPKVDSAVIKISLFKEKNYSVKDEKLLDRVIRGAFAQRRKNLTNTLSTEFPEIPKSEMSVLLTGLGFGGGTRGEMLGIGEYAAIADAIYEIKENCK